MTTRSFPALGFDPTPGDAGSVQTVVLAISRAMQAIASTLPRLQEAVKIAGDWDGDAADRFSDAGSDLPEGLGKGADSMQHAAKALATWGTQLQANQAKAEDLESKARALKKQIAQADDAVAAAARDIPHDVTSPHYDACYNAYLGQVDAAAKLDDQLRQIIADAHRLAAKHLREANSAADGVRSGPDDAFHPHTDDPWYVQALDTVAQVSGIVSAATGAAAAGLALTGVGAPAAGVLGTVAAGTGGISALAGVGQRIAGSSHAPSNLSLALSAIPGRTFTSAAVGAAKGLKPVLGETRALTAAKGAAGGAKDGFTANGLPKFAKDALETGRYARRTGSVLDGLKLKAATEGAGRALKGRAELAGEAFGNAVDATTRTIQASGGHLSIQDKRELEALKLLTNPRGEAAQNAVVNTATNELNNRNK